MKDGSTQEFFEVNTCFHSLCMRVDLLIHMIVHHIQKSDHHLYQKMWHAMEHFGPTVFLKTNQDGIDRVVKDNPGFAFFMESSSIEYFTHHNCNLTRVGPKLDEKSYGFGFPLSMTQFHISTLDRLWFR